MRAPHACLLGAALLLAAGAASAQSAQVAAEALFRDGKALLTAKKYAEACPKLEESLNLDATSGTALLLGMCREGEGKTASAWAAFSKAEALAQRQKRADHAKAAHARVAVLEPQLAKLTLDVPASSRVSGLEVVQDGTLVGSGAWGTAVPVDPGEHRVEARAPGMKAWSRTITIGVGPEAQTVTVGPLEAEPKADAPAAEQPRGLGPVRIAGLATAGVGALLTGIALGFGADAISKSNAAKAVCSPQQCTDPNAVATNDAAKSSADVSTALFVTGLALAATGAVLFFVPFGGKSADKAGLRTIPAVGPGVAGLSVEGRF